MFKYPILDTKVCKIKPVRKKYYTIRKQYERMVLMVTTPDGDTVCECTSLLDAVRCRRELQIIDMSDGLSVKEYYRIRKNKTN